MQIENYHDNFADNWSVKASCGHCSPSGEQKRMQKNGGYWGCLDDVWDKDGYGYKMRKETYIDCMHCKKIKIAFESGTSMQFFESMRKYELHAFVPLEDYLLAAQYNMTKMVQILEPYTLFLTSKNKKVQREFFTRLSKLNTKLAVAWAEKKLC